MVPSQLMLINSISMSTEENIVSDVGGENSFVIQDISQYWQQSETPGFWNIGKQYFELVESSS